MSTPALLNLARLPARLDGQQVAEVLGMQAHEIAILVRARLLTPIGRPHPNAIKFFASVDIEALARDRKWLDRAQREIQRHWRIKNHGGSDAPDSADAKSGEMGAEPENVRRTTRNRQNSNQVGMP